MATKPTDRTCFLLAPIGVPRSEVRARSDKLREFVIEPAVKDAGYKLVRADDIAAPGNITSQVIELVMHSPLVIADLSGSNPNVMYELALRHVVGKPVIQLASDSRSLPFDISGFRTIITDIDTLETARRARDELRHAIRHIDEHPADYATPLTTALDVAAIRRAAAPTNANRLDAPQAVVSALKDIDQRLQVLDFKVSASRPDPKGTEPYSRRVFIVHGHDGELKTELARFLERLDFEPVILHEQPDRGATIFAKLAGEMADVGFAFILLTPDDVGAPSVARDHLNPRARQNVVFEHGLFVGHLDPSRVCAVLKGDVEIPSDLHGVLYKRIPIDGTLLAIAFDLVRELRAAGYQVDANRL